jgi:hypothetical protein
MTSSSLAGIRIECLPNTGIECYRYTNLLSIVSVLLYYEQYSANGTNNKESECHPTSEE